MPERIQLNDDGGASAELAHRFSRERVIVLYRGLYIFADLIGSPGPTGVDLYELSGKPATPEESAIHTRLVATVETTTTVTHEDES